MSLIEKVKNGVYTIAEMSANHGGNLDKAIEIVHAAKESGADCLKIQTYTPDTMTIDCDSEYFKLKEGPWEGYSLYELYSEAATPWEWQKDIKRECDIIGIDFLSSAFDTSSADFLNKLGVEAFKISSFELVDIPLIQYVAKMGKPMIVSCGMGTIDEIQEAVNTMKNEGLSEDKIVLLKCTSAYPAELKDANLATVRDMAQKFGVSVGLSDHSIGTIAPIVAVANGARIIEKHLCLSRSDQSVDASFSTEPDEFKQLVKDVNDAYHSLGKIDYGAQEGEKTNYSSRRSIFAISDISSGDNFSEKNIQVIRPGYGIRPKYYDTLIKRKSKKNYKRGEPISEAEIPTEKE